MLGHQRGLAVLVDHQRAHRRLHRGKCPEQAARQLVIELLPVRCDVEVI